MEASWMKSQLLFLVWRNMGALRSLFDEYGSHARLYPALLTLLPALLLVITLFPSLLVRGGGPTLVALAASCGLIFFLADFARAQGMRVEPGLLREWGGWPTTICLRHESPHLGAHTRARYHRFLAQHVPDLLFPTPAGQAVDPTGADAVYASAVEWLKEQPKVRADPLVRKENAAYGFRRNLLGLKPFGITIALVSLLASSIALAAALNAGDDLTPYLRVAAAAAPSALLGSLAFSGVTVVIWLLVVNRKWVREGGNAYARALLATCDQLSAHQPDQLTTKIVDIKKTPPT